MGKNIVSNLSFNTWNILCVAAAMKPVINYKSGRVNELAWLGKRIDLIEKLF